MEQRLIDANALITCLRKDPLYPFVERYGMSGVIESQPTIEAEPVRHGKWIDEGQADDFFPHHTWRCSECGEQVLEIGVPWYKHCPECGARMDAE